MRSRRIGLAGAGALLAFLAVAACGRSSTGNDAMKRDLELAGSTGLELAPRSSGTQVVSSIEETPSAVPAKSTAHVRAPAKAPTKRTPVHQAAKVAQTPEQAVEETPAPAQPAPQEVIPATPAPTPNPVPTPQRRGGYKSIGEVIRNAPFPINP
jgi:hypothetical protein